MIRMTEKFDGSYSMQNLQESLKEVMGGEFTPSEIHEVILDTVKDNMRYYRACYNDSVRLLALLRSNTNPNIKVYDSYDFEFEKELNEVISNFNISRFKLDSPELHNEDED